MKFYGTGKIYFNAFAVVRCANRQCKNEMHLEAQHDHKGRRLYQGKRLRRPFRCPKCSHKEVVYLRTEVLLSKTATAFTHLSHREKKTYGVYAPRRRN